jgi:diguanylate cyclase (GGDEF)-like protein
MRKVSSIAALLGLLLLEGGAIYLSIRYLPLKFPMPLLTGTALAVCAGLAMGVLGRGPKDRGGSSPLPAEEPPAGSHERKEAGSINQQLEKLNKKLRKQIYDLHNLFEISISLSSILDPQQLIKSCVLTLLGQLQTNEAMVFLPNKHNNELLYPAYYKGFTQTKWKSFSVSIRDPMFKHFHKKLIAVDLTNVDRKYVNDKWQTLIDNGVVLLAPIIFKLQIKGLIALGQKMNNEMYSRSEQEIFSLLSHFISAAFSNSLLYQRMEQNSITDGLTGLHNYRYFKKRLSAEVVRAQRYKHPISLILLDVDHFKNYNDTLGHPAGDRALKKIAQLILSSIRKSDIAVRYGGEEFCIILPEVEKEGAFAFAERLRRLIEGYEFPGGDSQPGGRLTASLGVSSFPQDTIVMQDLIDKTDAALYRAKHLGRNKTCLYAESGV